MIVSPGTSVTSNAVPSNLCGSIKAGVRFLREGRSRDGQEADESAGDGGVGEMEALDGGHSDNERRFNEK